MGHMARMHEDRCSREVLFSRLRGVKHSRGRLAQSFVSTVCKDFQAANTPYAQGAWYERT